MQTIMLYRYIRPNGGVTVSTVKPDCECTELFRIVSDENHILTDGVNTSPCVDTDNPEAWSEVAENETTAKAHAYDILMGVSE